MELKQIKELMVAMRREKIRTLRIKEATGCELELERCFESESVPPHGTPAHLLSPPYHHPAFDPHPHRFPHPHGRVAEQERYPSQGVDVEKGEQKYVTSPMVGTFYATPSPDALAFVKVGDRVDPDTIVCVIEAMKVMNEVKAGVSGVVIEICAGHAQPVEFGTRLFRIQ